MEYKVKKGDSLAVIAERNNITLNQLLSANPRFKADPNRINIGDIIHLNKNKSSPKKSIVPIKKKGVKKTSNLVEEHFLVPFGQLTFDVEGQEKRGRYFSRVLHVPGAFSGATIGRGYDMGQRSKKEIVDDLRESRISLKIARCLVLCRGMKGKTAKEFIKVNALGEIEITPQQQKALFLLVYKELEGDVIRICNKADVIAKYGVTNWGNLDPLIKDIVVDLRYRGDYTGATRERLQPVLVKNSIKNLQKLMSDDVYWVESRNVPKNRFKRRAKYVLNHAG